MGNSGATPAAAEPFRATPQMADAADRRCHAVSAARPLAVADAATGLSASDYGARLLLRMARQRNPLGFVAIRPKENSKFLVKLFACFD